MNKPSIISVRRGIPGKCRYCACDQNGNPIMGFDCLGDIRKYWQKEIRWGHIALVRELDNRPDMSGVKEIHDMLEEILRNYGGDDGHEHQGTTVAGI